MSSTEDRLERELFDVVCTLVAASRGILEETTLQASARLGTAARQLAQLASELPDLSPERRDFYVDTAEQLSRLTGRYLGDRDDYVAFLDERMRDVAHEVRRDNGLPPLPERDA